MAKIVSSSGDYLVDSGGNNIVWPDVLGVIADLECAVEVVTGVGPIPGIVADLTAQPTLSEVTGVRGIIGVVASLTCQPTVGPVAGASDTITARVEFSVRRPEIQFVTRSPQIAFDVRRPTITFSARGGYDG